MPSIHSASAYLFFLFAWKHGKVLVPLYSFILAYILIMAVASRWHYIIDMPVGMTLAWASYKLAAWFTPLPNPNPAIAMPTAPEPLLTSSNDTLPRISSKRRGGKEYVSKSSTGWSPAI